MTTSARVSYIHSTIDPIEFPSKYWADSGFSSQLDNEDYPYGEALQQQGQLNRALADYLSREEERERVPSRYADFEDEDEVEQDGFEARKRSIFRERDGT